MGGSIKNKLMESLMGVFEHFLSLPWPSLGSFKSKKRRSFSAPFFGPPKGVVIRM